MKQFLLFLLLVCAALCGCHTHWTATGVYPEHSRRDTSVMNHQSYDSIYRNDSHDMDYHPSQDYIYLLDSIMMLKVDTMYIHDRQIEYRYKYLRDTCYLHRTDTIPVIKNVEVTKEVERPLTWFDYLCRYSFYLVLITLFVGLVRFVFKNRSAIYSFLSSINP